MKKALIVVDYQNDFVDGTLGFPGAEKLDGPIAQEIGRNRQQGADIIFTLDTHGNDYLNSAEGKALPVMHCIKDTVGHSLYGKTALAARESDVFFHKGAYGSLELGNYLAEKNYDEIELVGLVSNICVISNAVIAKAASPEAQVWVPAALTDSFDKALHKSTLDVMQGLNIKIII